VLAEVCFEDFADEELIGMSGPGRLVPFNEIPPQGFFSSCKVRSKRACAKLALSVNDDPVAWGSRAGPEVEAWRLFGAGHGGGGLSGTAAASTIAASHSAVVKYLFESLVTLSRPRRTSVYRLLADSPPSGASSLAAASSVRRVGSDMARPQTDRG
jgi:hypothetical protein